MVWMNQTDKGEKLALELYHFGLAASPRTTPHPSTPAWARDQLRDLCEVATLLSV
jgi:hypothetical protein